MRRRAVSRPVGSYHSARVWMPPPSAAGGEGKGGDAEGEGDVGVGGAEAEFGAEAEVTVDGAGGCGGWERCRAGRRRGGSR